MPKYRIIITAILLVTGLTVGGYGEEYGLRKISSLDIDIWVNKGTDATYYYGEDVAVYFRASDDCYVVVYDIDPAGNVSVLFPRDYDDDCFVKGGKIYRIPDYQDDYRLEVSGPRGYEYIYAVASYNYISPPDFIRYESYDYGDWNYYHSDFVHATRGEKDRFVADLNDRIVNGPYVQASVSFYINNYYRHHRWYRHWYDDPYAMGSVWIGVDWPGCEVWIDGCYWGIAPILVPSIYIGRHWVWIYYNGYPCWHDYIYVYQGRRAHVDVKIRRRDGRIVRYDGRDDDKIRRWELKHERYKNEDGFFSDNSKHRIDSEKALRRPPVRIIEKYTGKRPGGKDDTVKIPNVGYDRTGRPDNDRSFQGREDGKYGNSSPGRSDGKIPIRDDKGGRRKITETEAKPIIKQPAEIEKDSPKPIKEKARSPQKTNDDSKKYENSEIKSKESGKQPAKMEPVRKDDGQNSNNKRGRK